MSRNRRMPIICKKPGCSELAPVDVGYCDEHLRKPGPNLIIAPDSDHEPKPRTDEQRARQRLYDRKWRKRRKVQLAEHPWCHDCMEKGIYKGATEVHHVIPHRGDREIFEASPLMSLCHDCHSLRTWRENKFGVYYPNLDKPLPIESILVIGPPASGKTFFVEHRKRPGDIVSDLDTIMAEMTGKPFYAMQSKSTLRLAIARRNAKIEKLQDVENEGQRLWFIVGAPKPKDRKKWKKILRPSRTYVMDCPLHFCLTRIRRRACETEDELIKATERWFKNYKPLPGEIHIDSTG